LAKSSKYKQSDGLGGGYIGGHLVHPDQELGVAYDAAMREEILGPLGMSETTFRLFARLERRPRQSAWR